MGSMREILDRIKSINNIIKITNAMYLISSSKLKRHERIWRQPSPILKSCYTLCVVFCLVRRRI